MSIRILLLDIERSPNVAYVWGLFKENIPLARLIDTSQILCYAAKWLDNDAIFFDSIYAHTPKKMMKSLHTLLDEADVVVHYNGASFDIPVINTAFVELGFKPPSPYKQVDLLRVVRSQFKFTSNKLEHVAKQLGVGEKHTTTFELWTGCMNHDEDSWATMEAYNIQDVLILENLYQKLKPWVKNHPNFGVYEEDGLVCTNCGSHHYIKRGFSFTNSGKYQRLNCTDCGAWFRSRTMYEKGKESFRNV
jgi:hypothetical protein